MTPEVGQVVTVLRPRVHEVASDDATQAWRDHPEHPAQRRETDRYRSSYCIAVGTTEHAASFPRA